MLMHINLILYHTDTATKPFTNIFASTSLNRGGRSSKGFAIVQALTPHTSACGLLQEVRQGVRVVVTKVVVKAFVLDFVNSCVIHILYTKKCINGYIHIYICIGEYIPLFVSLFI